MSTFLKNAIVTLAYATVASSLSTKAGSTVDVDGTFYYVPSTPVSSLGVSWDQLKVAATSGSDLIPTTVMTGDFSTFDSGIFNATIASFAEKDDVFSTGFLQAVYLSSTTPTQLNATLDSVLSAYDNKLFMVSSCSDASVGTTTNTAPMPNGPYFVSAYTGDVFQAFRLYSDYEGAFTEGIIGHASGNFSALSAAVPGAQAPTIGVPSRLYYTKTAEQPLAGVRIGIKDIYDIAGTKRGCGSRTYYDLYPEKNTTAPVVQTLIDAGAIVVGKMKTSQFANGEHATADWVDYHSPFNARGDGYSDPSSSSSGPGGGIGAYSWLDLALGSDTGGSIRNPSQVNGCYGNRPTFDLVSLENIMPLSPLMDTAGFLTRDAELWSAAGHVLYDTKLTPYTSFPKKLYLTEFPKNASNEAEGIVLSFLSKLEAFLNTTSTVLDYDSRWSARNTSAPDLNTILDPTYQTLISKQQWTGLGAPFFADYAAAFDGRKPFIDPVPELRWAYGRNITNGTLDQAIHNKTMFKNWWNEEVMVKNPETCSDALLLYPGALARPNYRNGYLNPPRLISGWGVSSISIFSGAPDMVLPLGQAAYNSTITNHIEYLPVAVDIIAAPGCDAVIFDLAVKLQAAGIINAPKAGSTMYKREVRGGLE
ncbi:hypothetical protein HYALB_00000398 [Hymenoscyphus albidus]|uniref:Amidase domain-containing protein n=1 Tax=Hymenoscyphus albidus TaxID=595503 RepID=A0A9N9LLL4_9HELO|nr:hypothetical protein HYALB_00000398 [Hymenoscyphus albidus]